LVRLFNAADGTPGPRAVRQVALGAVALATALSVAACGGGSASSSSTSGTAKSSSFQKCLQEHGVTAPQGGFGGGGGGSTASPHPRPTGSGASSFRAAMQACGGSPGAHGGSGS
jgi:hypothetical protein